MARKTKCKNPKKLIYVFCEGQSEIQYINYMKDIFNNVSVLRPELGLIHDATAKFKNDSDHKNALSEIDEIWFFFDVEDYDRHANWSNWMRIIKSFNNSNKAKRIKIRLLLTTACIEYWFLLHYKKTNAPIQTKPDKIHVENELINFCEHYKKADKDSIYEIASNYKTAIKNGEWTLKHIEKIHPIPNTSTLERDTWLFMCDYTFTTVHEAISYLENLSKNSI